MTRPVIGLTTYNQKNKYGYPIAALMEKYITAINEAGGSSVLIPSTDDFGVIHSILDRVDGILFTGGGDIRTDHLGDSEIASLIEVDPVRDRTEISIFNSAVVLGIPIFGICRGIQLFNVAMGGSLYSHIPDQLPDAIKHDYDSGSERELLAHDVEIHPGTLLESVLGTTKLSVNSLHHQGVEVLAPDIRPCATAPDGLIEGLEIPGYSFGIGVQWHPEWLTNQEATKRLFMAFIDAAGTA